MTKKKAMFYRKAMGETEAGETIYVICRMDRGRCDFVYAEVIGNFPGGGEAGSMIPVITSILSAHLPKHWSIWASCR